ncbi:MAG: serine/threonine-protein kinase [Acidobacteriota bacterium]
MVDEAGSPEAFDRRVDALLCELLDLPAERRSQRLDEVCAGDQGLHEAVSSLLAAAESTDSLLRSGGALPRGSGEGLAIGTVLGRYRVLREIGRGGMGVVYLADRADGHFDQRAAVKVLSFRADGAEERFARERQILADLEHPGIARLLDGGVTAEDRPYLVMEHVDGVPIDRYCREQELDCRARVELLLEVCAAVQAAHRQLVVHRDLKPSNILVTAEGRIKLLDFGIAKLLDDPSMAPKAETSTWTSAAFLTPQYASPEQVLGRAVTVASDVYQLGMLAFELLVGCRPYETTGATAAEVEKRICHQPASRPSEARRALPAAEVTPGLPTSQELRGDLDTIVLEALRKEPERRYESVGRLRDDLRSYLRGLPVSARPDSWHYRLRKFIARNPLPVTTAVAAVALITFLVVNFTLQLARERDQTKAALERAEQQRQLAERRNRESIAVEDFLIGLFDVSDPTLSGAAGRDLTAVEILHRGVEDLRRSAVQGARSRSRLLTATGRIYSNLELFDEAGGLLEEALELVDEEPGDQRLRRAYVLVEVGDHLYQSGKTSEAVAPLREALALRRQALPPDHERVAAAATRLANVLQADGQIEESARLAMEALGIMEGLDGPPPEQFSMLLILIGYSKIRLGEMVEAEAFLQRALEHSRRHFEASSAQHIQVIEGLALVFVGKGDYEAAIPLLQSALQSHTETLGPQSFKVAVTQQSLASCFVGLGNLTEAMELTGKALATVEAIAGPRSRAALGLRHNLASQRLDSGDAAGAEADFRRLRVLQQEVLLPSHELHGVSLGDLGRALMAQGKDEEAENVLLQSLHQIEEHFGPRGQFITHTLLNLGRLYRRQGRFEEAETHLHRAHEIRRETMAADSPELEEVAEELRRLRLERGTGDESGSHAEGER